MGLFEKTATQKATLIAVRLVVLIVHDTITIKACGDSHIKKGAKHEALVRYYYFCTQKTGVTRP
jgi:hypothetical protein